MAEILPLTNGNLTRSTEEARLWLMNYDIIRLSMPLQLGVYEIILDIAPENISSAGVKNFLIQHTSTKVYYNSMLSSDHRWTLEGHPAEEVTLSDKRYCWKKLKELAPEDFDPNGPEYPYWLELPIPDDSA